MGCILVVSGDAFSSGHTASWLSVLLSSLSVVPANHFDTVHLIVRKTAHLVEYGLLGFLAYRAFQCTWPSSAADRLAFGTMVLVLACATADEAHQSAVVSRTGSFADVLLDALGACVGIYLFYLFSARGEASSTTEARTEVDA